MAVARNISQMRRRAHAGQTAPNNGPAGALAFLLAMAASTGSPGAAAGHDGALAFPGATGYGALATGWRGGQIVPVTSLSDHGAGSLRACAENAGEPRVCIFQVAGTIELETPILVGSNVYIAGQTAPGNGIQIRNLGGAHGPLILKNVSDVVIRFLKIRPGPSGEPSPTVDAVTVENSRRVYLGNLSMAFATDETFNVHVSGSVAVDITLADSLLALSLDHSSHPKGRHSKGALICSDEGEWRQCGRITLVGNLFAHHRDRNPDIKATGIGPVEVINNVFFDPISQFGEFYDLLGETRIAYVGNIALAGPSTVSNTPEAVQVFDWDEANTLILFARDNRSGSSPGCDENRADVLDQAARDHLVEGDGWALSADPIPVDQVLERVLAQAGDRLPDGGHRDALDAQIVADVLSCGGRVIDTVDQVGGWPEIEPAEAPRDSDGDGLPDNFEVALTGLDPDRPSNPWRTPVEGGLSHLEMWLAELAGDIR